MLDSFPPPRFGSRAGPVDVEGVVRRLGPVAGPLGDRRMT